MTKIINLYEHYKNSPKKLKIICDWDEVIQVCEPLAFYKRIKEVEKDLNWEFKKYFKEFWEPPLIVEYSPYGSGIKADYDFENDNPTLELTRHREIKNSPNFYQEAPFLTIAEDLLRLIREDKVEQIIFLIYCKILDVKQELGKVEIKRDGKIESVFKEVFGKFPNCSLEKIDYIEDDLGGKEFMWKKSVWIEKFASDFDLVIDDNPMICKSVVENNGTIEICEECRKYQKWDNINCKSCKKAKIKVIAPYYPAIKHDERVLLVKNEVSELEKIGRE